MGRSDFEIPSQVTEKAENALIDLQKNYRDFQNPKLGRILLETKARRY